MQIINVIEYIDGTNFIKSSNILVLKLIRII